MSGVPWRCILALAFCLMPAVGRGAVEYGVKVGACVADQTYSYLSYSESPGPAPVGVTERHEREGIAIGVFGHWSGSSQLGLMAEAQYMQKGIDLHGRQVDCVCFPLLPRYDAHISGVRLYVAAGPRLDMYLGSDDHESGLGTVEAGLDAVLGCQVSRFSVEARYSGSYEPTPPDGGITGSGDVWQVLLGWTLWQVD